MAEPEPLSHRIKSVLEDPSAQAVANVYADSFLNAAEQTGVEGGQAGALEEFASFLEDVLNQHPPFREILFSDYVKRDDKLGLIDRVVGPFGSPFFTNFLKVLARHERLNLLPLILRQSLSRYETLAGRRPVHVTSAQPLSDEALHQVRRQLQAALPFEPILHTKVDESLLGGLVIQIGDTVYDTSLKTRMRQLRDKLRRRSLHEVQRERDRFVTG